MGNSNGHTQKLPTVSSETTNQHFYPYWGVPPPQKKGYAVRRISAAPALDFAGDTFTTTNAVEYQPKPSSYVRPTGTTTVCVTCPVSVHVIPLRQASVHTTHKRVTCKRQPCFLSLCLSKGHVHLAANCNAAASADLTQSASMAELQVQLTCCKHASCIAAFMHALTHSIAVSSAMRSAAQIQRKGTCEQPQDTQQVLDPHLSLASKPKPISSYPAAQHVLGLSSLGCCQG